VTNIQTIEVSERDRRRSRRKSRGNDYWAASWKPRGKRTAKKSGAVMLNGADEGKRHQK
jgi:hypothetical protein